MERPCEKYIARWTIVVDINVGIKQESLDYFGFVLLIHIFTDAQMTKNLSRAFFTISGESPYLTWYMCLRREHNVREICDTNQSVSLYKKGYITYPVTCLCVTFIFRVV